MAAVICTSVFAHTCGLSPLKRTLQNSHSCSHKRRKVDSDDELPPLESFMGGLPKMEVMEKGEQRGKGFYNAVVDLTGEDSDGEDEGGREGGRFEPLPATTDPTDEGYDAEDEGAHEEDEQQQQQNQSLTSTVDLHKNTHDEQEEANPICMCKLTYPHRQAQYRKWFSHTAQPLSHMALPEECDIWPAFADEIHEAYLRHTTFTVKVWTNYDATAGRFFTANDQRYEDTGRLVISPTVMDKLDDFDTETGHIRRVRFEVGTAFETLCNVTIVLRRAADEHDTLETHVMMSQFDVNYHPYLANFLEGLVEDMSGLKLPSGTSGFTIGSIIGLAGWFRCVQTEVQAYEHASWPNDSPWMELARQGERNPGFVKLD